MSIILTILMMIHGILIMGGGVGVAVNMVV
jgi:hypothetical protein